MHFLINSPAKFARKRTVTGKTRRRVKRAKKAVRKAVATATAVDNKKARRYSLRSSPPHRSASSTPATRRHAKAGTPMATRRRRRRKTTTAAKVTHRRRKSTTKRRRRSAVASFASNPPKRRRRRSVLGFKRNPGKGKRRRYHRNPGLGNITSIVVEGVKDGATVFAAQVATRKIGAGINGMVPATLGASSPAIRGIGTRLAAAIAVSMIARKVAPARARLATAGAFAEVVNFAVAQSPTATSFLSAFPSRRVIPRGVSAYTRSPALSAGGRVGAYAMRSAGLPVQVG